MIRQLVSAGAGPHRVARRVRFPAGGFHHTETHKHDASARDTGAEPRVDLAQRDSRALCDRLGAVRVAVYRERDRVGGAARFGAAPAAEVVVLEVIVPDGWLKRSSRRGRYHTGGRDVPANRIVGIIPFSQLDCEGK